MRFAIQCILANNNDDKRVALRGEHLRYIEANKGFIARHFAILSLEKCWHIQLDY
jgi:hypothetical protein